MFKDRLRELRALHGYSMDDLVEVYNTRYGGKMNKSTLSRYENGLQEPMVYVVKNLAELLGTSMDYLSGSKEKPTTVSDDGLSEDEAKLIKLFHKVPENQRGLVVGMIEAALKSQGLL